MTQESAADLVGMLNRQSDDDDSPFKLFVESMFNARPGGYRFERLPEVLQVDLAKQIVNSMLDHLQSMANQKGFPAVEAYADKYGIPLEIFLDINAGVLWVLGQLQRGGGANSENDLLIQALGNVRRQTPPPPPEASPRPE